MTNIMKMMKQAASMRREMKNIQKRLAAKTFEANSGDGAVEVVVKGDMTVESVRLNADAIAALKPDRLEKLICTAVNKALSTAKQSAGAEMSRVTGGMDLGNLF